MISKLKTPQLVDRGGYMFFIVSHRLMAQFRRNGGSVSYNKGLDIPALSCVSLLLQYVTFKKGIHSAHSMAQSKE